MSRTFVAEDAFVVRLDVVTADPQLARVAALTGGQFDPARTVGLFRRRRFEKSVLLGDRGQRFFHPNIQLVLLDDLIPALDEIFLLGTVQP